MYMYSVYIRYVCMHEGVYMYVCTYVCICVCMHVCVCMYACIHMHTFPSTECAAYLPALLEVSTQTSGTF